KDSHLVIYRGIIVASTKHVLLFGDSLTAGYTKSGWLFHPYGEKLQTLFDAANLDVQVTIDGLSGDRVRFLPWEHRLRTQLEKMRRNEIAYGAIGSMMCMTPPTRKIYSTAFAPRIACAVGHVIGCCLMEVDTGRRRRNETCGGQRIASIFSVQSICRNQGPNDGYALHILRPLPLHRLSPEDKKLYWDDGVHCTAVGYDRMGELVFEVLKPLLGE
ncbi:hypothetical protein BC938DRAFT_482332, partial [Jimgerdemannia flammicorona]